MKNDINWNFDNSYSKLPDTFKENINPFSVKNPELIIPKIIQELTSKNIAIHSIKTETSSLEDVFLSLTGKSINE